MVTVQYVLPIPWGDWVLKSAEIYDTDTLKLVVVATLELKRFREDNKRLDALVQFTLDKLMTPQID